MGRRLKEVHGFEDVTEWLTIGLCIEIRHKRGSPEDPVPFRGRYAAGWV